MTTIKKISKFELMDLVHIAYDGDTDLFEKYHIGKVNLQLAVLKTMVLIEDAAKKKKLSYYKIIHNKTPIGYFVTYDNCLYSFGVSIKYRCKDVLVKWWTQVKSVLGKTFEAMLYENNTRAISFLERQGMKIINKDANKVVTLLNI